MSSYAIIRQIKVKSEAQFNGAQKENNREYFAPNVDKYRSYLNQTLVKNPYKNYMDFVEKKRVQIRLANKKNGTRNRMLRQVNTKDSKREYKSMMQEFVFSYSPGALSQKGGVEYCQLALEFIQEWYQNIEIISATIHLDETTPHIHIWSTYFDQNQCRFIQNSLQKRGLTNINYIRDAWHKKLHESGFKLLKQDGSIVKSHDGLKADYEKGQLKNKILKLEDIIATKNSEIKNLKVNLQKEVKPDKIEPFVPRIDTSKFEDENWDALTDDEWKIITEDAKKEVKFDKKMRNKLNDAKLAEIVKSEEAYAANLNHLSSRE